MSAAPVPRLSVARAARWPATGWLRGASVAALVLVPALALLVLAALPILEILRISLAESDGIRFRDLMVWRDEVLSLRLNFGNYLVLASDPFYVETYLSSLRYAAATTLLCLLAGFPFAYFLARARPELRPLLLMLVSLPFWTSYLLRIYACKAILDDHGALNLLLSFLPGAPSLHVMHSATAVVLGLVYTYLPFMVLPLYASLVRMDWRLVDAALDLGATPLSAFFRITVPLSRHGMVAGAMLVFIPSIGEYVIPELLGGPGTLMIGRVLWDEFFSNNDWGLACAVGVSMLLLLLVPLTRTGDIRRAGAGGSRP